VGCEMEVWRSFVCLAARDLPAPSSGRGVDVTGAGCNCSMEALGRWPGGSGNHSDPADGQVARLAHSHTSYECTPRLLAQPSHSGRRVFHTCKTPKDGSNLPDLANVPKDMYAGAAEGILREEADDHQSALILSAAGASGVSALGMKLGSTAAGQLRRPTATTAYALKPDSNTNLAQPRTLIPVVTRDFACDLSAEDYSIAVTSIFAVSATANGGRKASATRSLGKRWADKPTIFLEGDSTLQGDCIIFAPKPVNKVSSCG